MTRYQAYVLLLTIPLLVFASAAYAVVVVDQVNEFDHENGVGSFGGIFSDFKAAQIVTVGQTGELIGIDLFMIDIGSANSADVFVSILPIVPSDSAIVVDFLAVPPLATSGPVNGISIPEIESFVYFDFSSTPLSMTAGQTFVFVAYSSGLEGEEFQLRGRTNSYDGGNAYHGIGLADPIGTLDFGFRTYVATVPLPATAWFFLSALLGLASLKRRAQPPKACIANTDPRTTSNALRGATDYKSVVLLRY